MSGQLLFKVSLFRFCFVSVLQYLDCCYKQYPVKQAASLHLELPLKRTFLVCFFFFLER